MRKRILALGIVVIANSLAWGQSPREKSALSIADADSVRPNLETPASPEPKVRHSIFSLKEFERPVAANAEDAELLEATTHRTPRLWVRAEFMIWWIKPANFPPLVTTGDF